MTGPTGFQGPSGGGGGGGGITTYFMNDSNALAPSINQSIRIIAGDYFLGSMDPPPGWGPGNPALTIPTPTAINDYLNVQYLPSSNYYTIATSNTTPPTYLSVTFPSTATTTQAAFTNVSYVWAYNVGTSTSNWIVTTYAGSNSYYS